MGRNSGIEWTKHTWNPWTGCFKVSAGCKHCYMYREQNRYGNDPSQIKRTKPDTFNAPLKWNKTDPGLIFTSSWTDFFLPEADPAWRNEAWDIIRNTPNNTYQILTKRLDIADPLLMFPYDWGDGWDNVWLGVSIENQNMADYRVPKLLEMRATVRFLSIEPLLGPIKLADVHLNGIDWVIVGGESGSAATARPMHPHWGRDLLHQCQERDVPFFFKQWGRWGVDPLSKPDGTGRPLWPNGNFGDVNWHPNTFHIPGVFIMSPRGNKANGNFLDGGYWSQMPKVWEEQQKVAEYAKGGIWNG